MSKVFVVSLVILLISPCLVNAESHSTKEQNLQTTDVLSNLISARNPTEDVVVIPDSNPLFGIIGSYISCWYNTGESSGLKPMLVQHGGVLTNHQNLFIDNYMNGKNGSILALGKHFDTAFNTTEIIGLPPEVAIEAAKHVFSSASTIIIIPNNIDEYQLSLIASPLASYLDIPILIYDNNSEELEELCNILNVTNVLVIGNVQINLPSINITKLETVDETQDMLLTVIKDKFEGINYITLTNPSDVTPAYIIDTNQTTFGDHISNIKITFLGEEFDVKGRDNKQFNVAVPNGINRIQIYGNITGRFYSNSPIVPIIFLSLYDPFGNVVAYSSSLALDVGIVYLETLTCNASGNYRLVVSIYNGIKGGYFSQRGISLVDTDFEISIKICELEKPHLPLIPMLSITAPYLTAAHGGIIIADSNFELTNDSYADAAQGSCTGPWYDEKLHNFTNEKVRYVIEQLNDTLDHIGNFEMLDDYLNGQAWLAILAGTNMVPMYYYSPSQQDLHEKGLPSDNPYSLNWSLSVGRIVGYNIQDVSLLIARTLFYQEICDQPTKEKDWHNRFSFIFGEGFGETGGIFHQIPYALEIRKYGFHPRIFGDFRNGRILTQLLKAYTGSNYIEYLGHGDWFWFPPSWYGLDFYSKAIDVAHAKNWIYPKPSVFLTSACLMGRIDGIPPNMNIGLTMLHAGCNSFVGATRSTGSEAGLSILENHLIVDDFSIGEALRGEKRVDKEPPNYYVRVLYGDPAFNPYEPNNGFSNQGRPSI
ncbi:MAG: hypothetical protein JSW60_02560 [Thermoplasmatales archaeon]|nr:MAG: hypothetical protein JSW60_02560 [Thermoplasmatales archaeon]